MELSRQNAACRDVVAVAKPAWKAKYLEGSGQIGLFNELIDVQLNGLSTSHFEGKSGFDVAIGARSSQNEHSRFGHPKILSLIASEIRDSTRELTEKKSTQEKVGNQ
jgi:hypothetical protein